MNQLGKEGIPFLFFLDFEGRHGEIFPLGEEIHQGILFRIEDSQNYSTKFYPDTPVVLRKFPVTLNEYCLAFTKVKNEILYGNSYLLNLTFPSPVEINLSLEEIFHRSKARFKLLYKDEFVVFSPEPFILIENGFIYSFPMKGTIDARIANAAEVILADPKEEAEHNTIVDLIRNDLSMVATHISVERFRYIERLDTNNKSLLQVSSCIRGELARDYPEHIGDIITTLLPAGSISGAPKTKTLEIIKAVEVDARGYYTGIVGVFTGKKLVSGVMIRFIQKTKNGLVFRSGGGITAMSDCESEYLEMTDKIYVPIV